MSIATVEVQGAADGGDTVRVHTRDGVELDVYDTGARTAPRTVVFLHGLCLSRASWSLQIDYIRRRYADAVRIISYDHRGHGRSASAPIHTYRIDQLADDLAAVLSALGVTGPVTFVGHSMGGMAALAYLGRPKADRPIDPHSLVLIATAAGYLAQHGLGRLLRTPFTGPLVNLIGHAPENALRVLSRPLCVALSRLSTASSSMQQRTLAAVAVAALSATPAATALGFLPSLRSFDQSPVLGSIRTHTFVVSGEVDLLTPPTHSHRLADAIVGSVHVCVPGAGHMLPQEAAHVVNTVICQAMSRSSGNGATVGTAGCAS